MAQLRALLCALIVFLPLVVDARGPTPGPTLMPKPTHTPTPPFRTPTPTPTLQPTPDFHLFSLFLDVDSDYQYEHFNEPFVRVTLYSIDLPGAPIFEGYTDSRGMFCAGFHLGPPQGLLIDVHRSYPDGGLHRVLPNLQVCIEPLQPRSRVWCHATYSWPDRQHRFSCSIGH